MLQNLCIHVFSRVLYEAKLYVRLTVLHSYYSKMKIFSSKNLLVFTCFVLLFSQMGNNLSSGRLWQTKDGNHVLNLPPPSVSDNKQD